MILRSVLLAVAVLFSAPAQAAVALLQHATNTSTANSNSVSVTVSATGAGNLLVVGAANDGNNQVTSVSDGTNSFSSVPNSLSKTEGVQSVAEFWFLNTSTAGKTTITVTFNFTGAFTKEVWFWEVSGYTSPSVDTANHLDTATGSGLDYAGPAVTTTGSADFVVGLVDMAANVTGNPKTGNEFTTGGDISASSDGGCSLITTTPGQHQPVWTGDSTDQGYNVSVVAFREGASPNPTVQQSTDVATTANQTTLSIPVNSTAAGHLLVVTAANDGSRTVTGVSDGTNSFTQAVNSHGVNLNGTTDVSTWYLLSSTAGATTITVTYSGAAGTFMKEAWFWEVSGFTSPTLDISNHVSNGLASGTEFDGPTVATTGTYEFIAAAIIPQTNITQIPAPGNEFTTEGLSPSSTLDASASLATTTPGNHQPKWTGSSAAYYAASAAAFREGVNSNPRVVQTSSANSIANTNTITISVVATGSGNLLVVGASNTNAVTIASVSDGTNSFTQASNAAASAGSFRSDMWYLLSSTAGKTTITITFSGGAGTYYKEGWFWEVQGITSATFDVGGHTNNGVQSGGLATGPSLTTTGTKEFVAAIDLTSSAVYGPAPGNEFVYGGDQTADNDGSSSLITKTTGAHQPVWTDDGGSFVSSAAAFKAKSNAVRHRVRQF
jgi:hypothetical protein